MSVQLDWYFDYVSPFAYLQIEQFHRLPADVEIRFHPVLFAGLLNHWQSKGPAELPTKRTFTYQYVQWFAEKHGISLRFPNGHPFNPLPLLRLTTALNNDPETVLTIFRFIWANGHLPTDKAAWSELTSRLRVSDADELITQDSCKRQLIDNTRQAAELGVFGVPTFVAGGHLFWGADSLDFLTDFLANPALFSTDTMKRLADLPMAAQRV